MADREKVIRGLECIGGYRHMEANPCADCGYNECQTYAICVGEVARGALELLKADDELRLYTAEEMQHLPDRATVCIEMLISREDEERGYITGCGWGVVWNSTCAADGGTIVGGLLGSFFPNTITEIPFRAWTTTSDGKRKVQLYRFWTNRPTQEQSKAVKWDE